MIVNNHAVLILTVKGELRMGLIDLFQKTRETSMEMKPQEDEAAKVVTCKGCGAELKAYATARICMCARTADATDDCSRAHASVRSRIRTALRSCTPIWHRRTRSTSRDTQRKRQSWLKRSHAGRSQDRRV